jgi:hypothetical protein
VPLVQRHGGRGALVNFGSSERAREVEHDEVEAMVYVVGCEGAWR